MEQNLNKSGLKNLDPMRYWKYVMAVKREIPCVVIFNMLPKNLKDLVKKYPGTNFIVEFDNYKELPQDYFLPNLTYRWKDNLSEKEWLERWRWTDCLLCDENKPEYWLQAKLCGVSCVFNSVDLADFLKCSHVLNSVERIENWESAKNLLTQA